MRLERYEYGDEATFGTLHLPDGSTLDILECPWLDNRPNVSCVPEGTYHLEPHSSAKYADTWALVGETVSHWPSSKPRSACVFHIGNWAKDTRGCLLPGTEREVDMVVNSARAMELLRLAVMAEDQLPLLTIVDVSGREVEAMPEATLAETAPSDPSSGEARDVGRNLIGITVAAMVYLAGKVGLDLPDEAAGTAATFAWVWVSKKLAGLGKRLRQANSPTGVLGQIV